MSQTSEHQRLVNMASKQFPGSLTVAAGGYTSPMAKADGIVPSLFARPAKMNFMEWFGEVKVRLKELMWPEAMVTCLGCDGEGCHSCGNTGRSPFGIDPPEICKVELAVRLLMNAMPYCPPEQMKFADIAIEQICKRWAKLRSETNPPF